MISLRHVSYRVNDYSGAEKNLLADLNVDFKRGSRIALMGANGSGKTTLAKLIAGLATPSEGEVQIGSFKTTDKEFRQRLGKHVGFLFQNPEHQIISVNLERELALGLENHGFGQSEMKERVIAFMKTFGLKRKRHLAPSKLSGGEKQILALASVMILRPDILILDEPTAHLDKTGKALFRSELKRYMADASLTVFQITQEFEEIEDFERLIVLSDGQIAEDCPPGDMITDRKKMECYKIEYPRVVFSSQFDTSKLKEKFKSSDQTQSNRVRNDDDHIELECSGLSFGWEDDPENEVMSDVDLVLRSGQVYGILGRTGCGKTTLALILTGLLKHSKGEVRLGDKIVKREHLINSVAYLFQSPERGMFASSVYEDIAYGPRNYGITGEELKAAVRKRMEQTGLEYEEFGQRSPFNLSGGEARLAAIAGGIATGKKIIILDEPSEELDAACKGKIRNLIRDLAREGKAVMVISHDSDFIFQVSDNIGLWIDRKPVFYPKFELYKMMSFFKKAGSDIPKVIRLASEFDLYEEFISDKIDSLNHPLLVQFMEF